MVNLDLDKYHRPEINALAMQIEALLVATNVRGMETVRNRGYRGYLQRAVSTLLCKRERVAIVSGFPVAQGFETDGPAGALALVNGLCQLGAEVVLLGVDHYIATLQRCAPELQASHFLPVTPARARDQLRQFVAQFHPTLLVFVEVPGAGADGRYRNMRFRDITEQTLPWEQMLSLVDCPTLAFADGGNELGMGRLHQELYGLPVACATASTDELVIADVSNWGVYGALALASACVGRPLLQNFCLASCLRALNAGGIVDGVTGALSASEDGLLLSQSVAMFRALEVLAEAALGIPVGDEIAPLEECVA
ncbi:glutamate cyclase domain-containing protein [Microbulbifer pacificus]|uniref:DUF4392 domain-containing protein n=1 Tax=Microbulbifer pacificus TaxID=407164 RepID=A0AAU0MXF5_9GAMM|nr:glutamate cyclase domain-containing protein [Microbulbifer pacificus]WOX04727.1 DUF4392 domain-containing protein [Microbulbifer pacificus]